MLTCPSCGHENADGARFCSSCGTRLGQASEPAREERKVVTVLFADLVGFTSRAEQLDPEDVRAVLEPYHARLRTELERRGGTVEKFIGDAVMALFGAPTAHEDDPERAVRAALAIRDWIREEGDLQVRVAVTTGEALVALGARPSEGEGMASGDVVNTAARLQSAAPVDGILVDETTYRATQQPITVRAARAGARPRASRSRFLPGKRWKPARASASTSREPQRAPLVGRESEVGLLRDTLQRARRRRSPQLVTLVGVPGIGKSRLVSELFSGDRGRGRSSSIGARADPCPTAKASPIWALSEMVKAHAGILETDSADQVQERLVSVVAEVLEGASDRKWVEGHLGRSSAWPRRSRPAAIAQAEAFAAWRRFLEALAERARSCSSSRISTGRTTAFWTSSTTSSTGRPACRCSSSAPLAQSSSRAVPGGAEASRTRRRSRSRRSPTTTLRASSTLCSSGRSSRPIFRPR